MYVCMYYIAIYIYILYALYSYLYNFAYAMSCIAMAGCEFRCQLASFPPVCMLV